MKKRIILVIACSIILLNLSGCKKEIDDQDFVSQEVSCLKSNHEATLKSISSYKVDIKEVYKIPSGTSDNLKDFYCEAETLNIKGEYGGTVNCSNSRITSKYTYLGSINEAMELLENDGYKCFLNEGNNSEYLDNILNKKWCNYYQYNYYYTFDENNKAYQTYTSTDYDKEYFMQNDMLTINEGTYQTVYKYNPTNNRLEKFNTYSNTIEENDYLYECNGVESYNLVKVRYVVDDGYEQYSSPYPYKKEYVKYKCTNGNSGTWDDDAWKFTPKKNIKSECTVYFKEIK